MKKLLILSTLVLSSTLFAAPKAAEQLTMSIEEVKPSSANYKMLTTNNPRNKPLRGALNKNSDIQSLGGEDQQWQQPEPQPRRTIDDNIMTAGQIIQTARDVVGLGEAVYDLVQRGKPTNTTEYAPISVVPRDSTIPVERDATTVYVDPFDLEGFSMPVEKTFVVRFKNAAGKEVVVFDYRVMYSYGGSYNGTGKYLTGVIITPGSVVTKYGVDFNAKMNLSGIMNHGTKADPIAGVQLTIKYQVNTWGKAIERNDTIHITGTGQFRNYGTK